MISVVVVMKYCNYVGFSNIFLQPSFPKEKGVILNDTCRIVLLIALSILETLFLKLGGTYYIEIDKLRDYQQKLNIHHFLSCSIFAYGLYARFVIIISVLYNFLRLEISF